MARILSIDYGEKRTGLAWTDPLKISINPIPTIDTACFDETIYSLLKNEDVAEVVFGLPTHGDGNLTKVGKTVSQKVSQLELNFPNITFYTIDEAFTSKRARQMMLHLGAKKKKRELKSNIDQMSAVLILKDFIDSR